MAIVIAFVLAFIGGMTMWAAGSAAAGAGIPGDKRDYKRLENFGMVCGYVIICLGICAARYL